MSGSPDEHATHPALGETARRIRVDLRQLHRRWMALAFPVEAAADHAVVSYHPETLAGHVAHRLWRALGMAVIAATYLLAVLGFAVRYYARRVDRTAASLGGLGVVALSLLAWGALGAATYASAIPYQGFVAVVTAGGVATVSAGLAYAVSRRGGRAATVAVGYPLGVTALFLPPVVAALHSPTVAAVVFPGSTSLAVWLLDNPLAVGGLSAFIRSTFELEGLAYVGMWFGLAVPVGWALGLLAALPARVRARRAPGAADVAASWSGDHRG